VDVELAEERILVLADRFNLDYAEGRAWAKRVVQHGVKHVIEHRKREA
jgi:hypothetical protein